MWYNRHNEYSQLQLNIEGYLKLFKLLPVSTFHDSSFSFLNEAVAFRVISESGTNMAILTQLCCVFLSSRTQVS
jgi:hypothetical protein